VFASSSVGGELSIGVLVPEIPVAKHVLVMPARNASKGGIGLQTVPVARQSNAVGSGDHSVPEPDTVHPRRGVLVDGG